MAFSKKYGWWMVGAITILMIVVAYVLIDPTMNPNDDHLDNPSHWRTTRAVAVDASTDGWYVTWRLNDFQGHRVSQVAVDTSPRQRGYAVVGSVSDHGDFLPDAATRAEAASQFSYEKPERDQDHQLAFVFAALVAMVTWLAIGILALIVLGCVDLYRNVRRRLSPR